jgi:cytochrome c-type biogenesis protein CcmH/NrfG
MAVLTGLLPITTPLALIAFVVAAGFYAYRAHLLQRRRTIASLPARDRLAAVEATLTRFPIDTTNLTSTEKVDLVLAQIRAQAQRFLIGSIVVCVLAVIAGIVSIVSLPSLGKTKEPIAVAPVESHVNRKALLDDCLNRARAANPTTDQMVTAAKECEADAR